MQTEVLRLISRSLSNAKTSDTWSSSSRPTKTYVGRIMEGWTSREALTRS
jgi:DNA-binding CsgD family transcriptional regulator